MATTCPPPDPSGVVPSPAGQPGAAQLPDPRGLSPTRSKLPFYLGAGACAVIVVAGLTWAKWDPYWHKLFHVIATADLGTSILTGQAPAPPAPSWPAALHYAESYGRSIWVALVAGLVIAASVEAFLPRRWLVALLGGSRPPVALGRKRGRLAGSVAGGLLALPCMMCTCCGAPPTVSIRRQGASVSAGLAYWVGNPTLNPAVLAFMAIVLPWPWLVVRLVLGLVLVLGVTTLVSRLGSGHQPAPAPSPPAMAPSPPAPAPSPPAPSTDRDGPQGPMAAGRRFAAALVRLSVTLVPEYLAVVLLLGAFRGWLFPVAHGLASWGVAAVVVFALAGTLFVIPTAGEIPIIQGLLAAGVAAGPVGALVVTLPALSLPSMVMVSRSFPKRVVVAMAGAVAVLGLVAAALVVTLTGS